MNFSRRQVLRAAACLAATGCRAETAVLRPAKIINTHTHFYDPARPQGVPWPPKNDPLLYRTALPKHYRALPVPQRVDGTVVVEASPWIEDNQWILDLAAREPFIVGLVGNLPVGTPEFAGHLKRLAANPLFRGIRVRGASLETGLNDRALLDDLRALAAHGLSLDVPSQPAAVAQTDRLARSVRDLRIVVNHVAGVAVTGEAPPADWRRMMEKLAAHPQVFMKVSGLVEGTKRAQGGAPSNAEFYHPVLETLWDTFGADRLIYGSNWPVSERFAPLATVQQITMNFFATKGRPALDKVFWKNAQAAYRWLTR
jgi:L-fuconolactonase